MNLYSISAEGNAIKRRERELAMQGDAPGGHAAGAPVSLDPDDIVMLDLLRDELESEWETDDEGQVEELEEGYKVLCETWKKGYVSIVYSSDKCYLPLFQRRRKRVDYRTRADRTERQNQAWNSILPALVQAYLAFDCEGIPEESEGDKEYGPVIVVGLFSEIILLCLLYNLSNINMLEIQSVRLSASRTPGLALLLLLLRATGLYLPLLFILVLQSKSRLLSYTGG